MVLTKLAGHPESYRKRKEYKMGEVIGEGTFGIVRQAQWRGRSVAVKIIAKRLLKDNVDLVEQELRVLKQCHHPNIIQLFDDFESKDKVRLLFVFRIISSPTPRHGHRPHASRRRLAQSVRSILSPPPALSPCHPPSCSCCMMHQILTGLLCPSF